MYVDFHLLEKKTASDPPSHWAFEDKACTKTVVVYHVPGPMANPL